MLVLRLAMMSLLLCAATPGREELAPVAGASASSKSSS